MITMRKSWRCLSRRHLARISIIDIFGESSIYSGASATSLIRRASLVQSSSLICPVRIVCSGTRASADSSRMVISLRPISRLKNAVPSPCFMAAARAKSRASVLFPMAGLAAMTIIWPGCRPLVSESRSAKPVGTPVIAPPRLPIASISSSAPGMMSASE